MTLNHKHSSSNVSRAKHSSVSLCDYQESVTTRLTDARQSDLFVPICFAGDTINKAKYSNMTARQHFLKTLTFNP